MNGASSPAGDPLVTLAVGGSVAGAVTGVAVAQAYLAGAGTGALAVAGAVLGSWLLSLAGPYLIEPACAVVRPATRL